MDLTEMMGYLVIDLKMALDTEISTAEATRCIERAVDDMSRTIPRERIYEHTWIEAVTDNSFTTPADVSATYIVNGHALVSISAGDTLSIAAAPDVPRPVTWTLADADDSLYRLTLIIKGIDADNNAITETIHFAKYQTKTGTTKKSFKIVDEVEVDYINGTATGDTMSIGIGDFENIWVQLANPIKPDSEEIWSAASKAGTKYTKDTHYRMDYANGRIACLSVATGSMAAATTYYASYNKAQTAIDISSILPDLLRVVKVLYPADKIPEQAVAHTIWENMLTIGSPRPGVSQEAMVDKEHIAIYYEARHAPPTTFSPGSYPEYLNQVVLIGAGGYALLVEAIEHELLAATDTASARAALTAVTGSGIHGLITAALDTAGAKSALAGTALGKVSGLLTPIDTQDNAADVLAEIHDMETYLRGLIIKLSDGTGAINDASVYLAAVSTTDLDAATVGAVAWLLEGELLINKLTDGERVAEKFADYARAKIQIAQARTQAALGHLQEANTRLGMLRSYIEEAGAWTRIAEAFIAEASQRVGEASVYLTTAQARIAELDGYISTATGFQENANIDMLLSDRFRAEAQMRLNEFHDILKSKAEYRKRVVSVPVTQPR